MKWHHSKKILIGLLCAISLLFSVVSVPTFAVTANAVTATTNTTVTQGNTAYCYVAIQSLESLAALDISVYFDAAKVKITKVYNQVGCTLYDSVTNADNIQFSYLFDGKGASSKTNLFYFQYQVLSNADAGNAFFDVTVGEAYDIALNDVTISGSRCSFAIAQKVTNKTCSVYGNSSVSTAVGQEFTLDYRFSTYQIASGTVVITYDSELFQVLAVTPTVKGILTEKIVDINTNLTGEIYISFVGTECSSTSNFVSVTFKTLKNVGSSSQVFLKAVELLDKELNPISCSGYTTNAKIVFDETYTENAPIMNLKGEFSYDNKQITLTVELEENANLGAGDFVIKFNPQLVSYHSCTKEFTPSFFNVNDKNVENGELKFHIISLSDITSKETILTVVFDLKESYFGKTADFTLNGTGLTDSLTNGILLNFVDASVLLEYCVTFFDDNGKVLHSALYHYGDTILPPQTPAKESDVYGTYTFSGWDKSVVPCTANTTYTATYDLKYTDYTVKFLNWDGTIVSSDSYHYGDTVIVPSNPEKEADSTYTYTFKGWDKEITACQGDAMYTAVYTPQYIDYTVVFQNWDGTELLRQTYHYGDTITAPANPKKEADATYTYTFVGWNKDLTCTGDMVITATFVPEYIYYTVEFVDWNGIVLSTNSYHYGDAIIAPANPTREADSTYIYTFIGWDKGLTCTGDMTITAVYSSEFVDYTVVFQNWDGTVLSSQTYHYGDTVIVPSIPHREANNTYTYTFAGWDKEVTTCQGNFTYTATYTPVYIDYKVEFMDWNGMVLSSQTYHYGDVVVPPTNPTREADNTYIYSFKGWDKEITVCQGNTSYTATYTCKYIDYEVVFKNWDGTILSQNNYHYGDKVITPVDPIKDADDSYTYTFVGWDKDVGSCSGDATYTAVFTRDYIDYIVIFQNWDGTIISRLSYHYGEEVIIPDTPKKEADNTYAYSFAGWDKSVTTCQGNTTYTAVYDSTYIDYTVEFKNWDGTILSSKTYHYGDEVTSPPNPARESDNTYTYSFDGWNKQVSACQGNTIYTAIYIPTYINYTVVFENWDGTVLSSQTYHYGDRIIAPEVPTKSADVTYTYSFAGWDKSVGLCQGDAVYSATYVPVYIDYNVVFQDWDGTVLSTKYYHYGDEVIVPQNPTRGDDKTYGYTFVGWDKQVSVCQGDVTYTATYFSSFIDYTVIFKDWDGAVISSKTYHYGDEITVPTTPKKEADNTHIYTFAGWNRNVTNCQGNVTYTATYASTYIDYMIEFKDWDGTVLSSKTYHYGDSVAVPETPVRPYDETYIYTFVGWDKEITPCNGNMVYTAIYSKAEISPVSIEISALPSVLTYREGEDFDPAGLVVTAYYNNGTKAEVKDYLISGYDNALGTKTITISFYGLITTFQVVVEKAITLGDLNDDGQINAKDALVVLRIAVGKTLPTEEQKIAADVNNDGAVNAKDALEILKYAVGKSSVLDQKQ